MPMPAVLLPELVFAARVLRKSRGFMLVAATSLALAIGANTTIFSVAKQLQFERHYAESCTRPIPHCRW